MRRLIVIGVVSLVAAAVTVQTQTSLTGRWRAALLTPDGGRWTSSAPARPSPAQCRA
jgi:hypothetical protein